MFFELKFFRKNKFRFIYFVLIGLVVLICLGLFLYLQHNRWKKAESYYKTGQYQKVYDTLASEPMPTDPTRLDIYGRSMLATQHFDKALKAYEKLARTQNSLDTKLILANIKSEMGDANSSEDLYQEIIKENSNFVQAYLNLASLYRVQGKNEKANEILLEGVKNNPDSGGLYSYLISINADKKDSKEYKNWVDNLKRIDPNALIPS